jgi:N-methylhydantoinase A
VDNLKPQRISGRQKKARSDTTQKATTRKTTAYLGGKRLSVAVYQRDQLGRGTALATPCIVTEYSSTTLIPPGAKAEVDDFGNLIIQVE